MLPDLESLRCFEAAAVRLNFRAASQVVHLSPAAFSDRIHRLEDQLGKPLFVRSTRLVKLTPLGAALLPRVQQLLSDARACVDAARLDQDALPFALVLGTRFELGLSWITPALEPLKALTPQRILHLYFGDSEDLLARLHKGTLDAVVTSARLHSAGLQYALLHPETYVLVAAPALLRQHPFRGPQDAPVHTLLDVHADLPLFRYFMDARPSDQTWSFRQVHRLGTIGAIRQVCLAGGGMAVLPEYLVKPDLAGKQLTRVLPQVPILKDHFRLVWRTGHPHARELTELARQLRDLPLQ